MNTSKSLFQNSSSSRVDPESCVANRIKKRKKMKTPLKLFSLHADEEESLLDPKSPDLKRSRTDEDCDLVKSGFIDHHHYSSNDRISELPSMIISTTDQLYHNRQSFSLLDDDSSSIKSTSILKKKNNKNKKINNKNKNKKNKNIPMTTISDQILFSNSLPPPTINDNESILLLPLAIPISPPQESFSSIILPPPPLPSSPSLSSTNEYISLIKQSTQPHSISTITPPLLLQDSSSSSFVPIKIISSSTQTFNVTTTTSFSQSTSPIFFSKQIQHTPLPPLLSYSSFSSLFFSSSFQPLPLKIIHHPHLSILPSILYPQPPQSVHLKTMETITNTLLSTRSELSCKEEEIILLNEEIKKLILIQNDTRDKFTDNNKLFLDDNSSKNIQQESNRNNLDDLLSLKDLQIIQMKKELMNMILLETEMDMLKDELQDEKMKLMIINDEKSSLLNQLDHINNERTGMFLIIDQLKYNNQLANDRIQSLLFSNEMLSKNHPSLSITNIHIIDHLSLVSHNSTSLTSTPSPQTLFDPTTNNLLPSPPIISNQQPGLIKSLSNCQTRQLPTPKSSSNNIVFGQSFLKKTNQLNQNSVTLQPPPPPIISQTISQQEQIIPQFPSTISSNTPTAVITEISPSTSASIFTSSLNITPKPINLKSITPPSIVKSLISSLAISRQPPIPSNNSTIISQPLPSSFQSTPLKATLISSLYSSQLSSIKEESDELNIHQNQNQSSSQSSHNVQNSFPSSITVINEDQENFPPSHSPPTTFISQSSPSKKPIMSLAPTPPSQQVVTKISKSIVQISIPTPTSIKTMSFRAFRAAQNK